MKGLGSSVLPLTSGVRTDIEKLLYHFNEDPNIRFSRFAELFRDVKMSLIFSGRLSETELKEFAQKTLICALNFCFPPYGFQVRIGGLYLLYALYNCQSLKYRVKIRISIEQWVQLKDFVDELQRNSHIDTCYTFHKLAKDGAFLFCKYSPDVYSPLYFKNYSKKDDTQKGGEVLHKDDITASKILENKLCKEVSSIHRQYLSMKEEVITGVTVDQLKSLPDPVESVKEIFCEVPNYRHRSRVVAPEEDNSIRNSRAAVRQKACSVPVPVSSSNRRSKPSAKDSPNSSDISVGPLMKPSFPGKFEVATDTEKTDETTESDIPPRTKAVKRQHVGEPVDSNSKKRGKPAKPTTRRVVKKEGRDADDQLEISPPLDQPQTSKASRGQEAAGRSKSAKPCGSVTAKKRKQSESLNKGSPEKRVTRASLASPKQKSQEGKNKKK